MSSKTSKPVKFKLAVVDDQEIGGERLVLVSEKSAAHGVVAEQPVNRGGKAAGGFSEALRGAKYLWTHD